MVRKRNALHTSSCEGKRAHANAQENTMSTTTSSTHSASSILTIDEAAAYLAIPKATLYTWRTRRAGFGPRAVKFGSCLRYRRSDLDAWIADHLECSTSPRARQCSKTRRRIPRTTKRPAQTTRAEDGELEMATHGPITADLTLAELADLWLSQLRAESRLENTTINEYERVLNKLVLPQLGALRLHELTTNRIDGVLQDLGAQSLNRQRKTKVVTGAMLEEAVRHGALSVNPARQATSVPRPRAEPRSLTPDDLMTVRTAVRAWTAKDRPGPRATTDMSDIIDLMLATGARIGEVLALRWSDIDLEAVPPTLSVNGTIKNEPGKGTHRRAIERVRTVALPEFAVVLLRRRSAIQGNRVDAVFPTRNGTWQQVNNVERRWRQIRKDTGLEWVTPHAFRKVGAHGSTNP
ncbi:MAG: tyrosine-type recombinase/integrase [Nocardioides sp.]